MLGRVREETLWRRSRDEAVECALRMKSKTRDGEAVGNDANDS